MYWFDRTAHFLSRLGQIAAGFMLVAMVFHTILEMVLRAFFDTSTFVLDEFVGYEVAALTALGLGYALNSGGIIRVNLVTQSLRPEYHRWVDLAVVAVTFVLCLFILRYYWLAVETAFVRDTRSNTLAATPQWLPMSLFMTGIGIFSLQLLAYAGRLITRGELITAKGDGY